jgi:hypothetical protein
MSVFAARFADHFKHMVSTLDPLARKAFGSSVTKNMQHTLSKVFLMYKNACQNRLELEWLGIFVMFFLLIMAVRKLGCFLCCCCTQRKQSSGKEHTHIHVVDWEKEIDALDESLQVGRKRLSALNWWQRKLWQLKVAAIAVGLVLCVVLYKFGMVGQLFSRWSGSGILVLLVSLIYLYACFSMYFECIFNAYLFVPGSASS